MSKLFSALKIKDVTLKNRIVVSPMCQYSAVEGYANNWHLVHLGSRAVGGAGLIFTEAVAVSPEGRISPEDLGIYKEDHIDFLKTITSFLEEQGAVPGIQIAHAGRKGSTYPEWKGHGAVPAEEGGWIPVAPSAVSFADNYAKPTALSLDEIQRIKKDFITAAQRALAAGFKVLEIHGAHGYLIHQFLSPLSNKRDDQYGGSFENRTRFLLETVEAVQQVWPKDLPLFVRISATDWVEGGWDEKESLELAKILQQKGVDAIDVSTGGMVPDAKIPVGSGYQLPFASLIKHNTDLVVGTVGMITNASQAETILVNKDADLIFMARELLRDPYFPLHAAKEVHQDITWPNQYRRAKLK
ncbi:MAG: oxidoreductase [Pseudopedobacter saltans]|uniref:Oxidoreductase n=1 Tax=Pseudopedobacter saltans TaxID=151895 RepID=A0A2W5F8A5_9SPHI|nr:MAG: oxidoreductase [Pseudopedobacter saltans]